MLADPRAAALVENFAGQWLFLRNLQSATAGRRRVPRLRRQLAAGDAARDGALVRARHARGPQRQRAADGRLHVRQRAIGEALRHTERLRQPLPSSARRRRRAPRAAGPREHLDGHVVPEPHVAGAARQVGARERARRAAAAAAAGRARRSRRTRLGKAARTLRERLAEHRANPVCATCHDVMDPIGLGLENFDAIGKWRTREPGGEIDAHGQLVDGTQIDGAAALREALTAESRAVRARVHGEAADVRARPRSRGSRHADGAPHRARGRRRRLPLLGARQRHREQRAVPHAPRADRRTRRGRTS